MRQASAAEGSGSDVIMPRLLCGDLVGIVTDRDLRNASPSWATRLTAAEIHSQMHTTTEWMHDLVIGLLINRYEFGHSL